MTIRRHRGLRDGETNEDMEFLFSFRVNAIRKTVRMVLLDLGSARKDARMSGDYNRSHGVSISSMEHCKYPSLEQFLAAAIAEGVNLPEDHL